MIENIDIGPAGHKWTINYLIQKLSGKEVRVHVSEQTKLNFISKNFKYQTMKMENLLKEASDFNTKETFYLRSIGNDKRGKEVANLKNDFPEIADDFIFPPFLPIDDHSSHFFSSVLRIASPSFNLWTHYDVMDNILINIKGSKRVVLFPPSDVPFLYLEKDKSKIIDIDASSGEINLNFPLFNQATKYECILGEKEGIFIPSFWFHNVTSLEFSIGINIFWKNASLALDEVYDKSDSYGNKDLIPGKTSLNEIDKALKHIQKLPIKYQLFYSHLMINKINNYINQITNKNVPI